MAVVPNSKANFQQGVFYWSIILMGIQQATNAHIWQSCLNSNVSTEMSQGENEVLYDTLNC